MLSSSFQTSLVSCLSPLPSTSSPSSLLSSFLHWSYCLFVCCWLSRSFLFVFSYITQITHTQIEKKFEEYKELYQRTNDELIAEIKTINQDKYNHFKAEFKLVRNVCVVCVWCVCGVCVCDVRSVWCWCDKGVSLCVVVSVVIAFLSLLFLLFPSRSHIASHELSLIFIVASLAFSVFRVHLLSFFVCSFFFLFFLLFS